MHKDSVWKTLGRPAVVTVGDELVFGEHANDNLRWLLRAFWDKGRPAAVALVLPDSEPVIGAWLESLLQAQHAPIFVSGGLGGTHDDCTRAGIARALGVPLVRHKACFKLLAAKYGERFTAGRQRMAMLPAGCTLIANPLGAPGFSSGCVYAFPGFPRMLHPMAEAVLNELFPATAVWAPLVYEVRLPLSEGEVAWDMESFAASHPGAQLGLYPHAEHFPREVTVRLRYDRNDPAVRTAFEQIIAAIRHRHGIPA